VHATTTHIRHIQHLLTTKIAQTFACSLILSRIDYCNSVLYRALMTTIHKQQRVQNNASRIVLQMPKRTHAKPLLEKLHWLPAEQRIRYKIAMLTFKVRSTLTPAYLNRHIYDLERQCTWSLATQALFEPFTRTNYAKRAFRCSAPDVCNSLPRTVLDCVLTLTYTRQPRFDGLQKY